MIKTSLSDRWAILGSTGSGKTHASMRIMDEMVKQTALKGNPIPVYILDTKIDKTVNARYNKEGIGVVYQGNDVPPIHKPQEVGAYYSIWRPLFDDFEMYDEFFFQVYQEARQGGRGAIIYIDELSSIKKGSNSNTMPRYYEVLQKQGRSIGQSGVGIINCFQSATWLPTDFLRNATHILRFRLGHDDDQKKMGKIAKRLKDEPLSDYGLLYKNMTIPIAKKGGEVMEFEKIEHFLGI